MPYPGPDAMDQTLRSVMQQRIAGQNPDGYTDAERVQNLNASNDATLRTKAQILASLPEMREKGITAEDIFTALVNDGQRFFANKAGAEALRSRGVPAMNTATGWADSIIQTLSDRLQSTPAQAPILGKQVPFRGPGER